MFLQFAIRLVQFIRSSIFCLRRLLFFWALNKLSKSTILKRHQKNHYQFLCLLLAGCFLLTFTSCQKEEVAGPENPSPVVDKIKEFNNGEEFIRFAYNADGSLQKATVKNELSTAGNTVEYTISYNGQKKIAEVITSLGEKIVPVYENNVMIRADVFDGPVQTGYTSYHYENNQLKIATIYFFEGPDFQPLFEFRYTHDAAGNVVETIALLATGEPGYLARAGHVSAQFDAKINPLYEHRDFLALLWQAVSKNNPTKEEHFAADLSPEDVYSYTYSYKSNGLPEKADVTKGLPGEPPVVTTLGFLYQ